MVLRCDHAATSNDELGRFELRALHTLVQQLLHGVKVANDCAVLNCLCHYLNQHDRCLFGFLHVSLELVVEEDEQAAPDKHQQGDAIQRKHAICEGGWQEMDGESQWRSLLHKALSAQIGWCRLVEAAIGTVVRTRGGDENRSWRQFDQSG